MDIWCQERGRGLRGLGRKKWARSGVWVCSPRGAIWANLLRNSVIRKLACIGHWSESLSALARASLCVSHPTAVSGVRCERTSATDSASSTLVCADGEILVLARPPHLIRLCHRVVVFFNGVATVRQRVSGGRVRPLRAQGACASDTISFTHVWRAERVTRTRAHETRMP